MRNRSDREKISEGLVNFNRREIIAAKLTVSAFDQKMVGARQISREIEGFLCFLLCFFVIT